MITKLLVANRGEIACRVIATARAMGIATVAVHSDVDRDALHVELADEAVRVGGTTPATSYLRGDALLTAAARTGADAVHPGYGFLSERADFARACADAGLTFVGPGPEAIRAMGDKLAAKRLLADAGVPVLPAHDPGDVPDEAFPVMVKAALGGGGKGMRIVEEPAGLAEALDGARRESAAAFGDDTVFVERYLSEPRHIEVQIIADDHGGVVHLGERECSIQRRHQKVIEESPSPLLTAGLRARMGTAAVAAARAIGYRNAGTVEFVATAAGDFFFLEVNTRLQVEHPVTEMAWRAGAEPLDLVRLQLLVAAGEPLGFAQDDVRPIGHAIEARLYAEDPDADFLPAAGTLAVFEVPAAPGLRVDTGVRSGDSVSVHYDPLIAKVIASAPTRGEAVSRLARGLERSRVHGITTNRDFLVACLRHPAFAAGALHTGFIDAHLPKGARGSPRSRAAVRLHAAAAALAASRARHRSGAVLRTIPPAWRNNPAPQQVTFTAADGVALEVRYAPRRDGTWSVEVDDDALVIEVVAWPDQRDDGRLVVVHEGRRLPVRVTAAAGAWHVDSPLGADELMTVPRFPRSVARAVAGAHTAPMPGTVVAVEVSEGDHVGAGEVLLLLEAMKMEHRVTAAADGTVTAVHVRTGDAVDTDTVLVVLGEDGAEEPA
jgi:propionyl-CoA carboxylase alpha chain